MDKKLHGVPVEVLETITPKIEPVIAFWSFVPDLCARWEMNDSCAAGNRGDHNAGFPHLL